MSPRRLPFVVCFVLLLAGCTSSPSPSASPSVPSSTVAPPPTVEPTGDGVEYEVTYGFALPSAAITISNPLTPPIGPLPLPYLVGVYVGNHPEGSPAYQRISFYFRGAFPSYTFHYVPEVISDGRGTPVALQGNAFLSIVFVDAQAHDDAGRSTVAAAAPASIGFANLKSYAPAGDFEGHVSYGLGIQVAPNSGQVLPIRSGELKRPDGAGAFFYVVHFDVQTS